MARLKAKIDGQWITGSNAQQLVNNALECRADTACSKTVNEYASEFIKLFKGGGAIEQNTLIGYKGYLKNHILPALGDKAVSAVTVSDVQMYINANAEKLAAKTIKEHINLMAEMFDGAVEDDLIGKNPFRSKRLKIIGKKSEPVEALSEDEYRNFERDVLPTLTGSTQLYAAITLYTGMRQGEICALRWEDIDFQHNRIRIRKAVAWPSQNAGILKEPKTENGKRNSVIIPQLMAILKEHEQPTGYLIRGARSKDDVPITHQAMTRLNQRIKRAIKDAGDACAFGNRRGRHTIATFMNNAEVDNKTIENQLGHYSAAFTSRQYMNAQEKQVERGMNKLSAYISQI